MCHVGRRVVPVEAARPSRSPRRRDARSNPPLPTVHNGGRMRRNRDRGRGNGHRIGRFVSGLGRNRRRLRQQEQRVDVALLVGRKPDPKMDVRLRHLRLAARADGAHAGSLGDGLAPPHGVRAQMHEHDGVPVLGPDRHRPAARGDPARKRDRARHGRGDRATRLGADVDSSMLPGLVRMLAVKREGREHLSADGPAPAESGRRSDQGGSESR